MTGDGRLDLRHNDFNQCGNIAALEGYYARVVGNRFNMTACQTTGWEWLPPEFLRLRDMKSLFMRHNQVSGDVWSWGRATQEWRGYDIDATDYTQARWHGPAAQWLRERGPDPAFCTPADWREAGHDANSTWGPEGEKETPCP